MKLLLRPPRRVLAALTVAVVAVGFVSTAYAFHLLGSRPPDCSVRPTGVANTAIFTVVMANGGFNVGLNDSKYHPSPWPVMNVSLGQNVVIHVWNNDSSQAHGFTVTHYFDSGLTLSPGNCFDVRFVASQLGSFNVFCQIFCTIHLSMQNGRLNVNP
jgi:heme/copper-type cytochrome/quinol oxidase subunit 2